MFGSVDSVVRYNLFSRMFVVLAYKLLGATAVGYVEDIAFACPISLGQEAMAAFQKLSDICGAKLEKKKASFRHANIFLGIEGSTPSRSNGIQLSARPRSGKGEKWSSMLKTFLTDDAIEREWMC